VFVPSSLTAREVVDGSAAILAGSSILRNANAPQWYRVASIGLAVLGLLSFVMLVVDSKTAAISILPDGVWERGSVDSIIVWQVFTAAYLLTGSR
jgi:hypothetical protein